MKKILVFLLVLLPTIALAKKEVVYIYNWSEYLPDHVLSSFQKETGIRVVYSTYDSNEAMYAKIKLLKGGGYDVVFPSTYYVDKMRKEGLLSELDMNYLPNLKNLEVSLLNKDYDPGNKYSIPYLWGSSSIGINSDHIDPSTITSFKDLWREDFKNKVILTDDVREVFGMGLSLLGYSINDKNSDHIRKAYELLKTLKPNIRLYNSESPKLAFLNGEVSIGLTFNGEIYAASRENKAFKYIYPKEGAIFWIDNMVVLKNSKNKDNAHTFINYLMKPEIAKLISEEIGYPTPNKTALFMMDKSVKNNKTVYPDPETIKQGEFQKDVGDAILIYEKYWEKLKSSN